MGSLPADLRHAARMLARNPGFTFICIATLALGIGANTAIFSVVNAVLLRPLSFRDPGRLFAVEEQTPRFKDFGGALPVSADHFLKWHRRVRSFDGLALAGEIALNLTGNGDPQRLHAARVSANFFPLFGVQPRLGRGFREDEDHPGRDHVVILSDPLWRERFDADPSVLGRKITLDGDPYEIIGVMPPDTHIPKLNQLDAMPGPAGAATELWKPFAIRDEELDDMGDFNFVCIARLKRGVTPAQALADLNAAQASIAEALPEKVELRALLVPMQDQLTGKSRLGLLLLMSATGVVLLIACVNIANLLLALAAGRRRELAIRAALGSGTARLVRQLLTESMLLAFAGGAAGLALAWAVLRVILSAAPVDLPRLDEVGLDSRVLLFTLFAAVASGLLFGLLPAWRFARSDPQEALKSGSHQNTQSRGSGRLHGWLTGLEAALSAVCLIAGGLLLHSFVKLMSVDTGFEVQRILTVALSLPEPQYSDAVQRARFQDGMLTRVESLPGVRSAAVSNHFLLSGEGGNNVLEPEGVHRPMVEWLLADFRCVNPDYFRTFGVPLLRGRIFDESVRGRPVAVISQRVAQSLWPGRSPIGLRFHLGSESSPLIEVTGVSAEVRGVTLDHAPNPTVYLPYWQRSQNGITLAVRTTLDPAALASSVRGAIHAIDPGMPVPAFRTMRQVVSESVAPRRFQMDLVLLFGVVALLLASLGIYGVVSYSVARRTNEMGIRMALGAEAGDLERLVLRQGMTPVIVGLAAGVAASLVLGSLLESLLFGVDATDPLTIAGVVLVLGFMAAVASWVPARRATRVDPMIALRYE